MRPSEPPRGLYLSAAPACCLHTCMPQSSDLGLRPRSSGEVLRRSRGLPLFSGGVASPSREVIVLSLSPLWCPVSASPTGRHRLWWSLAAVGDYFYPASSTSRSGQPHLPFRHSYFTTASGPCQGVWPVKFQAAHPAASASSSA